MWGYNLLGGLAQNNRTGYSSPVQIPGEWTSLHQSTDASYQTFVSKTAGSLWSMGFNASGNLGVNNTTYYSSPKQIPGTNWTTSVTNGMSVGHTGYNMAALKTDGTLWVWGRGSDGEGGWNTTTAKSSPVQLPGTNWSCLLYTSPSPRDRG